MAQNYTHPALIAVRETPEWKATAGLAAHAAAQTYGGDAWRMRRQGLDAVLARMEREAIEAWNTTTDPVALICSECGEGNYYPDGFAGGDTYECEECGHRIAGSDVDLEAGERMTLTTDGALAYASAAESETLHRGHFTMWGMWFCDTCQSPYCDLA